LIDCFATWTVPIYWGAPDIAEYFNAKGMYVFESIKQILDWRQLFNRGTYESMLPYIEENYYRATEYCVPEDWIYANYPFIFSEKGKK
jgi:hypothetical protein